MTKISNDTIVTTSTKRIAAIKKHLPNKKTAIPIGGATLTPDAVVAVYQDDIDKRAEVATTKAAYGAAVAARMQSTEKRKAVDEAFGPWILNTFGPASTEAKEFGYAPRKKPTMTAHTRAQAVNANLATRIARGTVGRTEKKKIHGAPAATQPAAQAPAPAASPVAPAVSGTTPSGGGNNNGGNGK